MCKVVEEYIKIEVKDGIISLLKQGVSPEIIANSFKQYTLQEIIAIKDGIVPVA